AVWLIDAGREIARFPYADSRARDGDAVGAVRLPHRLARHHEGVERGEVLAGELGEMVVRKRRIEMPAVAIDALAQRARKCLQRPATDAAVGVGRDVGAVDRAERRLDRRAAGIGLAILRGVAAEA